MVLAHPRKTSFDKSKRQWRNKFFQAMTLAEQLLSGNRLALTRLLTQVENDTSEGRAALTELFPHTGKAHLVGVTGAPGTGKSSPF